VNKSKMLNNKSKNTLDSVVIQVVNQVESTPGWPPEVRRIMEQSLLNIGFGNAVAADRVVAIVSPNSAPMKRLKDEAKQEKRLVDVTHGRRTRSIIVMDSNHIILSAIQAETVSQRFTSLKSAKETKE
jgi:extracellular matrix regulatory protein A